MARARSDAGSRGGLRTAALILAVLVALAATVTVVVSDDPETLRIAVVGALWAFVLAAFAAPRRRFDDQPATPGSEVELRRTYEIELEREVAARREYELQLEVYLRRELERGLTEDVAALRDEIGRMRGEMMDRLDGELRMERIETTRLVGGSLRALQDQARRLGIDLPVPAELSSPDVLAASPYPGSIFEEPAPAPTPFEYGGSGAAAPAPHPSYGDPGPDPFGAPAYPGGYGPGYPPPNYPPAPSGYQAPPPAGYSTPAGYAPPAPLPPAPRQPAAGESVPPRRHRAREDGEDNEVMSRLLGR
jgi:hypothetical protein